MDSSPRKESESGSQTEFKPREIDPVRIASFLGSWRYQKGSGGWEFLFPKNPEEDIELKIQLSDRFVRIYTPTIPSGININITRPDVKSVKILGENNEFTPNRIDNPRLAVFTRVGYILLYRDRLDMTEVVYGAGKNVNSESHIPLGDVIAVNKLHRLNFVPKPTTSPEL